MLGLKRLSVAQYERALVFRERSLERVLTPGVYWLWDPLQRLAVKVFDVNTPELTLPRPEILRDEELYRLLWDTINKLYDKRIVLDFTDHLTDRELYCLIGSDGD